MALINVYSPGIGMNPNTTMRVNNPWPGSSVWAQCTTSVTSTDSEDGYIAAFGIIEYQYVAANGTTQTVVIQQPGNLGEVQIFSLLPRQFIPKMVSITLVYIADDGGTNTNLTLFQWG